MPARKRSGRGEMVGRRLWISYRLQSLTTEKFITITNKIINGEHLLLKIEKMTGAG